MIFNSYALIDLEYPITLCIYLPKAECVSGKIWLPVYLLW